ncbi:pre-mRNA cleavage complex 2 protein Pcf11 isoform X2 [Pectinophora gossypiella]|uniref:pre-mRNA cleavage complex 2 protein Pcf11 isoform X2 n=1 Tax=Pectinophora gossypiella TaxID=13191 RepID=UPI00214E4AAC|nr:pre-mRNA cleavage complex 2 protein Pcf11 isoform X2 [Pectinophora gossypiella]
MSKEKEIAEEYASSLADLTVNSKPLINMLTILAEENVEHAGVIVETVEKHLEKVHPDIKLPVLYLVDSIIKNVGGAYTQKFSQSIVNMFTRTFKQVDEKIRSQMFKLRETWHDVFPATKLYQLDVKVNLIDPAWPIQAQPQQSNIHNATAATTSATPSLTEEEEKMRSILAKKEQELLMLQQKKIEMQLEQTRRQLEMAEKNAKKSSVTPVSAPVSVMPIAMVNPVVAPVMPAAPEINLPVKARLGPPVSKPAGGRIAPVSAALAAARRDPRLARHPPPPPPPAVAAAAPAAPAPHPAPHPAPPAPIAPNVFDIKPLERVTKRKNVITYDVQPAAARPAPARPPRRRDPRLDKRGDARRDRARARRDEPDRKPAKPDENHKDVKKNDRPLDDASVDKYIDKLVDPKKINKLPPIPKINRDEAKERDAPSPVKRKKDAPKVDKKKKKDAEAKDSSSGSSPEKKAKAKERVKRAKEREPEATPVVAFKELKNYHKERYMRRNKEQSESPEPAPSAPADASNIPEVVNKDVDLRVLPAVETKPAAVGQKRPSTETAEGKAKKNKLDKFDILFGNEDVDLRQLPQVEEVAPPPPSIDSINDHKLDDISPQRSPRRDWNEVKEKEEVKKTPSKLDLVRAKLAEATKGKDRLGRPLLFSKSPSVERERRRTLSTEDTDLRPEPAEEFDAEDHKKTISIIMNQAKEQFSDGQLDKSQYNTLMYQVLQLNEKLKLKEAKQRESLESSKRKLKAHIQEQNHKISSPRSSPNARNTFGDIDERVTPSVFMDTPPDSQGYLHDSDMRMGAMDTMDGPRPGLLPIPPGMPSMYNMPYNWRGPRPRVDEYAPRRFRGPAPPFYRGKFDKRAPRPPFDPRMPLPPLPTPKIGTYQGECPLKPYEPMEAPPPLGAPGVVIPPTDYKVIEYIDQDPVKTIQIDGVPREIRFYGDTAIIMLDWDDPREIKFLPGCRRVTFDNKDSVVLSFNEPYKQVEIDDQVFDMRFGAPTRELFINGRWWECYFGGQPLGVIIDGKPRLVHLEGPLPQVDIGKTKRTDLVAGKINLIVNATQMCPVYLDAKVQKITINGQFFTIRFVDSLKTVLINEQPFKVEFGDLPKPITVGNEKYFIRFSALPRNVKPGFIKIANMEGSMLPAVLPPVLSLGLPMLPTAMEVDEEAPRPNKTPSPVGVNQGLDMLASVMPSNMETPASASAYSLAEPLFAKPEKIPGLETPAEEKPPTATLPILGNINVADLFAKLVATGIVKMPDDVKAENKDVVREKKEEVKPAPPKEDKTKIHRVDLLRPETLRVKQPGLVAKLYGGMQCSGCGARFPPEHTVRYSQHLDWHFRQNRRERDSARRAHSRHWHYDLSDWVQYEEVEDLEEREKSWFEVGGEAAAAGEAAPEPPPSVAAGAPADQHCALCGDKFQQFYNEDLEEWHLRNSVRHNDCNYHPACYQDYKASLTKEEPEAAEAEFVEEVPLQEPCIVDADDINSQSDTESVVEVVETEDNLPVEIEEEGDEDDVVFKAEPVEEVVVNDDADTDDETVTERAERDRLAMIDFAKVKVKQEPIDPDDEPILCSVSQPGVPEPSAPRVQSSIDGNVVAAAPAAAPAPRPLPIRINISKPLAPAQPLDRMLEDVSADDEPLPPGEEPELEYTLKPGLEGVQFSRQPPVQRGNELSGLCSIM